MEIKIEKWWRVTRDSQWPEEISVIRTTSKMVVLTKKDYKGSYIKMKKECEYHNVFEKFAHALNFIEQRLMRYVELYENHLQSAKSDLVEFRKKKYETWQSTNPS